MIVHKGYENLNLLRPVVTLGIFDGVHAGHRFLLDHLVSRAHEEKGESVVISFYPHPRFVLSPKRSDLSFLTDMEERRELLEKAGIDHLVIIEFNPELSNMTACSFIHEVLLKKIKSKHLIVGYNNHFGKHEGENFETIKQCAESFNIKVEKVEGLRTGKGAISSSSIRKALLTGKLDAANKWLGYNYSMNGTIVEGKHIGKSIGFPTANIKTDYQFKLIPKDGVYAVEVHIEDIKYFGMLSIGLNPTINPKSDIRSIEVHIFDFDRNIYGKKIYVVFRYRMRDEIRFEDIGQLVEQIKLDKRHALELLSE